MINETVRFWPTLFIDRIDNREGFPNDPARRVDKDENFFGKLNLPIGVVWEKATIDFNTTVLLHELAFGGGNIQIQVEF